MSRQFNIRVTEASNGAASGIFWGLMIIALLVGSYFYTHRNTNTSSLNDNITKLQRLVKE